MNVLVNGGGNIGTTLCALLVEFKDLLGIGEIYLRKQTNFPWRIEDNERLKNKGIKIISGSKDPRDYYHFLGEIDYVFEATSSGIGLKNKEFYTGIKSCAQGSEKGFGIPYMSGVNDDKIKNSSHVQVVSCNTHGAASVLQAFSDNDFSNINSADFVVVRRSEDIGNHERLVSANVVARHLDETIGTHHAIDVNDMLKTINVNFPITSSDITTPSQLMHATRFNVELNHAVSQKEILDRITAAKYIAATNKFDSNLVFELGRRYGFHGRIFSHAIVVTNNLLIENNRIKGWAFIPQEGNSLISTIHAFLLQTNNKNQEDIMSTIQEELLNTEW